MTTGTTPHVLILPKWWPNSTDPQLGDFLRKQVQAIRTVTAVSVLLIERDREHAVSVIQEDGLPIVRSTYPPSESKVRVLRRAANLLRYWRAARSGYAAVSNAYGKPDIAHVHIMVRPSLVARWLLWKHDIPYLISEQSSEYLDGTYASKSAIFKALNRYLFRRAAGVTVVSQWLGSGLEKLGLVTQYGIVPNVVPGLDRPLPPAGDPEHFLVVADLVDKTKNVSGVIRAFAKLREHRKAPTLTVIGDGPDRQRLEALVRSFDLEPFVNFLGRLPNSEVLDHMAMKGTVIINSNVETFSVVTGEALAQGKPVIATRCGGPESFVTTKNGILVNVGDDDDLYLAMDRMATGRYHHDPEGIRATVLERFSPAVVGKTFLKHYQTALDHG